MTRKIIFLVVVEHMHRFLFRFSVCPLSQFLFLCLGYKLLRHARNSEVGTSSLESLSYWGSINMYELREVPFTFPWSRGKHHSSVCFPKFPPALRISSSLKRKGASWAFIFFSFWQYKGLEANVVSQNFHFTCYSKSKAQIMDSWSCPVLYQEVI